MVAPFNPAMTATIAPPIMEAHHWLDGIDFPTDRPLLNVSQAAPTAPPPKGLRAAIADAAMNDPTVHLYGPILGLPELRQELATQGSKTYGGTILADNVAITTGCNQAFTAALSTIARAGDEVILPTPWYFNHKMYLDMSEISAVALATNTEMLPDPVVAEALITAKTKAIVLVSPNNPAGVEYPAALVMRFYLLAKKHRLSLIIDETYRDFDIRDGAPHALFTDPDWSDTLIQLYSFSKAYRLTGHRVGAMAASPARLCQVEKYIDAVTICPNQLAQRAALWGMQNLTDWLADERAEILRRRDAIKTGMGRLPDWKLLGLGAYFAYVQHPFDLPSREVARQMVSQAGVLCLPGSMFRPAGDPRGEKELRLAFANMDCVGIDTLFSRLENLAL